MSDETRKILFDMENHLCEKINTDKTVTSQSEMQSFNRGVAEGMRLIRKLLDDDDNNDKFLKEIDLEIK